MSLLSAKICGRISALALAGLTVTSAFAHPGHPTAIGFSEGFAHPFSGIDHLLAMLAVGLPARSAKAQDRSDRTQAAERPQVAAATSMRAARRQHNCAE